MRFEFDDLRRWQFTVVEISSGHYRVSAVRDGGDIRAESSGLQPEKMLEELKLWAATTEGELSALSGQHRNGARGPDDRAGVWRSARRRARGHLGQELRRRPAPVLTRHSHRVLIGMGLAVAGCFVMTLWTVIDPDRFRTFYSRRGSQEFSAMETRVLGVMATAVFGALLVSCLVAYRRASKGISDRRVR